MNNTLNAFVPKKYLVIQLARLGDLIQTKRLLYSLYYEPVPNFANGNLAKNITHTSEIHLCVDASLESFAKKLFPFAQVYGIIAHNHMTDKTDKNLISSNASKILTLNREIFQTLSNISFDQVYNLNFSGLNYSLAALFDSRIVRGYYREQGSQALSLWTKFIWRWTSQRRSSPLNLADFWALLADFPYPAELVSPIAGRFRSIKKTESEGLSQFIQTQSSFSKENKIGIVLAGRESRRSLPPACLAKVIKAIFEGQGGPKLVLLGSKSEQILAHQLMREFSPSMLEKTENLAGKTGLLDLFELVESCNQILTPDTGLMHLAAHLGVAIQAFFLSSAWSWETGPYGQGHMIWQATPACSPCVESQPCSCKTQLCLEPFSSKAFLSHLSGRYVPELPDDFCGLVSSFDSLGVCYDAVDGQSPMQEERMILRSLLGEQKGLFFADWLGDTSKSSELAEYLFKELDWITENK
ncbi:glycosyltransferase family 9 protein [Desulfovibrio litoralis]|uniref:ADP-heptose:LPS heptosyltransferase n=1 Tax=Desulfovibrio litoralis DSM 11393 TaxID=1121455 RepID=A0A1M7THJ3_9BACT|nr:glycosyltransferase family 9 protein [Desulfovibrio litoralis]SHN70176.1 ADP-heptose:LPS heptosyltransferase [Desulfovibrio litoralis DSM 11393]